MVTTKQMAGLWIFSVALGLWPVISIAGEGESATPNFTATQAADGNLSYLFFCAECHGVNMQGADIAPPLAAGGSAIVVFALAP